MKKLLVIGVISSFFSAGAFAAACTVAADGTGTSNPSSTTTVGSATNPTPATEQCVCNGGNAGKQIVNGGSGTVITTPVFVKNGFNVQCSANTIVSYDEVSPTAFAVASGSKKGNQSFMGSSNGGSVTTYQKCTGNNSACFGTDVTNAHGAAVTAATSS